MEENVFKEAGKKNSRCHECDKVIINVRLVDGYLKPDKYEVLDKKHKVEEKPVKRKCFSFYCSEAKEVISDQINKAGMADVPTFCPKGLRNIFQEQKYEKEQKDSKELIAKIKEA